MIKNHHIAKSLTDSSLSEIIRQLEYKSKWKNKKYGSEYRSLFCGLGMVTNVKK